MNVEIETRGPVGTVKLNGVELLNVQSYRWEHRAGSQPVITIEVVVVPTKLSVNGKDAIVLQYGNEGGAGRISTGSTP